MNCYKCGKELEEGSQFCAHCGANQDKKGDLKQKNKKSIAIVSVLIILLGIACIIIGIYISDMTEGFIELEESYGGDAYTGIQQAAAQTANNVRYLTQVVKYGFSASFVVTGILIILLQLKNIFEINALEIEKMKEE